MVPVNTVYMHVLVCSYDEVAPLTLAVVHLTLDLIIISFSSYLTTSPSSLLIKQKELNLSHASEIVRSRAEKVFLYSARPVVGCSLGSSTMLSGLAASHGLSTLMTSPAGCVVKPG